MTSTTSSRPTAPAAPRQPKALNIHGNRRIDPYHWLRDRDDPAVIDYLKAENDYTEAIMGHTEALQKQLYDEMLGRIQETDLSVPYRYGNYYYYSRTEEGKAYSIYCRKRGSLDAAEECLLDSNQLAEGQEYFSLGDFDISPDHRLLAYSTDVNGSERYTLVFKTLENNRHFDEQIADVGGVAWANDNNTVFYIRIDEAHRPYQLWRHTLGSDPSGDVLVHEETDEAYYLSIGTTRSEAYLVMYSNSKVTSEISVLDANQPLGDFQLIQPRQQGVEYWLAHHPGNGEGSDSASDSDGNRFYIITNEDAINFKLMVTPVATPGKDHWREIIPHRKDVMLSDIDVFADHLVIYERQGGLPTIHVRKLSTDEEQTITFPEPAYEVSGGTMPEFDTQTLRFTYTSLVTPSSVFDYDMNSHERELKKETPVLGGYDRTQYCSKRLMAIAEDGTEVPISLVYRSDITISKNTPLFLSGYGSYGYPYPAAFSSNRLSLLDRGIVCAIAHVRGGGEMGRKWYELGKLLEKKNTFTDFIDCTTHLIQQGWTSPEHLVIYGGSAGGLLMGAVVNQRPDLFKAVIAAVPFVDVVTTILDTSLPLSVLEWDEWGNPNDHDYYDCMLSYSPYDNVTTQDYPNMLITGGLNDPRVGFWEPAKWTAKLREMKTDQNQLLLKTNLDAGHAGASGRYGRLKELAFEYAFLLDCLGLS